MVEMAKNTRPFVSIEIWNMLGQFMDFMRNLPGEEGANYRAVYKDFSAAHLVKRLLFKRPVVFWKKNDSFILRWNGNAAIEGSNKHLDVAKKLKKSLDAPHLFDYISYDENLLSSLICMSTPTFYVSDGSSKSKSVKSHKPHIEKGILCGLVGARNAKQGFMENRFVCPRSSKHSTNVHMSDDFWIKSVYSEAFPEGKIPSKEEIQACPQLYHSIYEDGVNVVYFEKRLMFSIVPYIREAMARGIEMKRDIFCAVPGIGSGVWRGKINAVLVIKLIIQGILKFLDREFDVCHFSPLKALALPVTNLLNYSTYQPTGKIKEIKIDENEKISIIFNDPKDHKIEIFNEFRYVGGLLPDEFASCLSVAAYAWDGNSYPGNEYWCGKLSSFDSQAIYCSLLGQFQNPEVNIKLADEERIKMY